MAVEEAPERAYAEAMPARGELRLKLLTAADPLPRLLLFFRHRLEELVYTLGDDNPEFSQMRPDRIRQHRPLTHE